MWNGRDPKKEIGFDGARFGAIEHWQHGIITRCVLLDVPRHRGTKFVTEDRPVHGWELDDILTKRGVKLEPGDAVAVYSGREAWQAQDPEKPYSKVVRPVGTLIRPGLHVSCLPFLRDHDVSVLVWDMLDALPIGYDIPWAVHALPVRLRLRAGGQRAARAAGAGVSGGRARRVHADRVAAAGDGRDGLAGESAGDVLSQQR